MTRFKPEPPPFHSSLGSTITQANPKTTTTMTTPKTQYLPAPELLWAGKYVYRQKKLWNMYGAGPTRAWVDITDTNMTLYRPNTEDHLAILPRDSFMPLVIDTPILGLPRSAYEESILLVMCDRVNFLKGEYVLTFDSEEHFKHTCYALGQMFDLCDRWCTNLVLGLLLVVSAVEIFSAWGGQGVLVLGPAAGILVEVGFLFNALLAVGIYCRVCGRQPVGDRQGHEVTAGQQLVEPDDQQKNNEGPKPGCVRCQGYLEKDHLMRKECLMQKFLRGKLGEPVGTCWQLLDSEIDHLRNTTEPKTVAEGFSNAISKMAMFLPNEVRRVQLWLFGPGSEAVLLAAKQLHKRNKALLKDGKPLVQGPWGS